MRTESIDGFSPKGREIRCYNAMKYRPRILHLDVSGRKNSTFFYIRAGHYRYRFRDAQFDACAGDIVYIPRGASYTCDIDKGECFCVQFEFDVFTYPDAEIVVFSDVPTPVVRNASRETAAHFESIVSSVLSEDSELYTVGNIFVFLSEIAENHREVAHTTRSDRVIDAVEYLKRHFTEDISVGKLAELCFLSETHFRRLFFASTGMSAIKYKNRLLTDAAKKMLSSTDRSVVEIADALGYSSVYAFSQAFKKETGVSPSAYRRSVSDNAYGVKE